MSGNGVKATLRVIGWLNLAGGVIGGLAFGMISESYAIFFVALAVGVVAGLFFAVIPFWMAHVLDDLGRIASNTAGVISEAPSSEKAPSAREDAPAAEKTPPAAESVKLKACLFCGELIPKITSVCVYCRRRA